MAGGKSTQEHKIILALFQPNYSMAGLIRNRVIERFGADRLADRNIWTHTKWWCDLRT